jgi:regulator of sirC expression with transglutaminase-like and TPR domain
VNQTTIPAAAQAALTALLDDPSPAVHQALLAHFERLGAASGSFLQAVASGPDGSVAAAARAYLRELKLSDPVTDFRNFINSLNYELESGVLLLNRTQNPALDIVAVRAQLDALAARYHQLEPAAPGLRAQCQLLNQVLFTELGLRGNHDHYSDPLNSFLDQVLKRRLGLPISLAIVYLLVAQRVGLELEPVGAPGHFLVGAYEPEGPFFIDAYNRGQILEPDEVFARLRAMHHAPQLGDLAPTPVREVLCRCCRNLANHYAAAQDVARAQLYSGFASEFDAVHERSARP